MRGHKALINTIWGLVYELVNIVCSFVLPRLILGAFGSEYNGVANSISQFLGVISLFQAGINAVTRAALYKPLAEKSRYEISVIVKTTELFLRKVVFLFVVFAVLLSFIYPYVVTVSFSHIFTTSLILIMSLSTFVQYFLGQTYRFLFFADQRQSFIFAIDSVKIAASTLVSAILIKLGFGIIEMQIGSAVVFVIAPIFLSIYGKRKYQIITNVKPDNSKIKQRWDNFAQACADFISNNTDLVVLSILSNVYEVSVYVIYNLIMKGLLGAFTPFVHSFGAAFGNMFAKNEHESVRNNLLLTEQAIFTSSTFLFGIAAATLIPFVLIYTHGVHDVEYKRTVFAYLFVASTLFRCFRQPYVCIINAVGHFKQTRNAAIIEAVLNIVVSIILVFKLGIVGVIIGTLTANVYRLIMYAWYVSKNVVKRSPLIFIKRTVISVLVVALIAIIPYIIDFGAINNYVKWIGYALIISLISFGIILVTEYMFYRDDLHENIKKLKKIVLGRKVR